MPNCIQADDASGEAGEAPARTVTLPEGSLPTSSQVSIATVTPVKIRAPVSSGATLAGKRKHNADAAAGAGGDADADVAETRS